MTADVSIQVQQETGALVEQYGKNLGDSLAELVKEQKGDAENKELEQAVEWRIVKLGTHVCCY